MVAVRVTSEDANDGFKPTCGSIDELSFRTSPDMWGYFSVKSGGGIHEFSDSQARAPLHLPACFQTCCPLPAAGKQASDRDNGILLPSFALLVAVLMHMTACPTAPCCKCWEPFGLSWSGLSWPEPTGPSWPCC